MSFVVRLASDLAQVEAGATLPLSVEASNRGDESDELEIRIEGLDPEWTAVPVPSFSVEPHEVHTEKVMLKPPRMTESIAGTYPFVVSVRSLKSGEVRSAQAVLEIKPFHHVSVDANPKKGAVSPFNKEFAFDVTVMNLGNSEHTVQMFASDPEDECAFEFEHEKITLGPGQQKSVEMRASGKRRPLLANSRLHGISVSARSVSTPTVAGQVQVQLEQRALISPGGFIAVLVALIFIIGWIAFIPKPPTLDVFSASPSEVLVGDEIQIDWRASENARAVRVFIGEQPAQEYDRLGNDKFTAKQPGTLRIRAFAVAGDRQSEAKIVEIVVKARPVAPLPEIIAFRIVPNKVGRGETVVVEYEVNEAVTEAKLFPQERKLDPSGGRVELVAESTGEHTYTLVVYNKDGKRAEASAKFSVVKASKAKIALFKADPDSLESAGGVTRLTWAVPSAAYVELSYIDRDGQPFKERVEPTGSLATKDVDIAKTTEFTLTAYDDEGLMTTKKVTCTVKPIEDPPPDPNGEGNR
ncbi:MAG TPA: hypothetical protein PLL78_06865 [Fimbriimonadaceae bacterium]|nr:hypothetical protein [Fimbriimonadaceae bacterium]HRJ96391.1 hypothetical protein [Fimbriimonadaceae bacterium]